jgi:hypothetical protein
LEAENLSELEKIVVGESVADRVKPAEGTNAPDGTKYSEAGNLLEGKKLDDPWKTADFVNFIVGRCDIEGENSRVA